MAILLLLMGAVFYMVSATAKVWQRSSSQTQSFQAARAAYESFTRKLAQATLNTYWDYEYDANGIPTRYKRQSELHFISGKASDLTGTANPLRPTHGLFFLAPIGYAGSAYVSNQKLLNACGYFVEFGSDQNDRPAFLTTPLQWRYRLKEFWQPSEQLSIYSYTSGKPDWPVSPALGNDWFSTDLASSPAHVRNLADNIVALIVLPRLSEREDYPGTALAPDYNYNSRRSMVYQGRDKNGAAIPGSTGNIKHQMPPLVRVVMVAIREPSAARLAAANGTNAPALVDPLLFSDSSKLEEDLDKLCNNLASLNIEYRVFSSIVTIEGAKWSTD